MKRLVQAAVVLVGVFAAVVAFAAAQLIRSESSSPPTEAARTIQSHASPASALSAVLARSCGDCHSDKPAWPSYARIAPVSWVAARTVAEGRRVVDFSAWDAYSPEQQRALLAQSCNAVSAGRMPGLWTLVRPETRLSARDIETICAAAAR